MKYFATAPNGVADLLAGELRDLGALEVKETRAGATFEGTIEIAYRACLWSRLANRILLPLGEFPADSPEMLYDAVQGIDWSEHLDASQTLAIDTNVSTSNITHSHYAALKIKDAIVDQFAERFGERPSVELTTPDIRLNCYIFKNSASLYLDLSGASLHQRNYRLIAGQAPLKENLAAAILLRAGWPSIFDDGGAFVDVMCGSGTLVLEAALMAADIAPALTRDYFGFLGWKQHQPDIWTRLLAEADFRKEKGLTRLPLMMGFDADHRIIEAAESNAVRAGLADKVQFVRQDIFNFRQDLPAQGLLVTNPPYGRRLAETDELPALYRAIGDVAKHKFRGWKFCLFTEDGALGKHLGMRADKLHSLFNGAVPCKLIHFFVEEKNFYRDERLPRPVEQETLSEQAVMFRNRLQKNCKQLRKWARRQDVTNYRVYDADLPDFSAAIDVYRSAKTDNECWVCVQEYEAPASIAEEKVKLRTREMLSVVRAEFDVDDGHLFYKTRARKRGESQYEKLDSGQKFHIVREGSALLRVNFGDYLDTGLFLDHRPIRMRLRDEARGRSFLNLFAYTGSATVQAVAGGAIKTTTIDMSKTYLEWAEKNLDLNGLASPDHEFIQADCVQWLARNKIDEKYDLIFLDPPSFSNSKRMSDSFNIASDHATLIRQAMKRLNPDGVLYFSTNLRQFKLDEKLEGVFQVSDITAQTIDEDFKRRQRIHQCWTFKLRV